MTSSCELTSWKKSSRTLWSSLVFLRWHKIILLFPFFNLSDLGQMSKGQDVPTFLDHLNTFTSELQRAHLAEVNVHKKEVERLKELLATKEQEWLQEKRKCVCLNFYKQLTSPRVFPRLSCLTFSPLEFLFIHVYFCSDGCSISDFLSRHSTGY